MCFWFIVELETKADAFALVSCKHLWLSERGMRNDHILLCFILFVLLEDFLPNQRTIASFYFLLRSRESKDVNRKKTHLVRKQSPELLLREEAADERRRENLRTKCLTSL